LADAKSGQPSVAAAPPAPATVSLGSTPEIAVRLLDDNERERQMKEQAASAERERLASQVAAFEADKARLANERHALELAMSESLARAQAERERCGKTGGGGNRALAGRGTRSAANDGAVDAAAACRIDLPGDQRARSAWRHLRGRSRYSQAWLPLIADRD